jgi:hypothetical protein
MVEAYSWNLGEALETGRLEPPMACENHIVLIDNYRIQETEFPDARRDLPDLLLRMGSGISRAGTKRSYWDKLGTRQSNFATR